MEEENKNKAEETDREINEVEIKEESELMEWIKSIVIAVVIAIFIKTFIFNTTYVLGNSMYPTLHEKDRLFANKIPLYFSGPERGDIVLLDAPDVEDKKYIKRVIGLEGDLVEIIDGLVYVNEELLEEDYIEEGMYTHVYNEYVWKVPEGHVFVLGDNREAGASKDSRSFNSIPIRSLKGITKFRFYPFGETFGRID